LKLEREEQCMNDAGIILAVMAGVLAIIVIVLLLGAAKIREKVASEAERRAVAEEKSSRVPVLEENLDKAKQENILLQTRMSELETRLEDERKNGEEKLSLLQEARDQLKLEFQNVANKIFEDKSQKFTEQNKENIEGVLKPMREHLSDFKKKVEDVYDKESKERVSLLSEIGHLKSLNERISEECQRRGAAPSPRCYCAFAGR
jgi:DNA recombination protein RmuC